MSRAFWCLLGLLLASHASAAEIHRTPGKDGEQDFIFVKGQIKEGDDKAFKALALASDSAVVMLDSSGGSLSVALEIGRTVRIKEFATSVTDAECASACALIWLAGEPRMVAGSAGIGFHEAFRKKPDGTVESTSSGNARIGAYLHSLGLNEKVVAFVTSADAEGMSWLTRGVAEGLGLPITVMGDQSHARANFNRAVHLHYKNPPETAEVLRLYQLSADEGFAGAQNNLGDMYERADGVPEDLAAAAYWYTRAAERGEPTAYLSLSTLLDASKDERVLVEALKYALLAVDKLPDGINKATAQRTADKLLKQLPQAAIAKAKALVGTWDPLYQERYLMSDKPTAAKAGREEQ